MTHHTRLRFGDDAHSRLLAGATALADALRITLGPRSRSVLIGAYGDLLAAGIVDPVKVVRIALENAVSVAGTLLLAEATMTEIDDDAAKPAPQASAV